MTKNTRQRVEAGQHLSLQEMAEVVDGIMQGQWSDDEIAQFLDALTRKGETVAEIAGAAHALRKHMTPIRTQRTGVVDTCGTGGDGASTFNISTASALVTAAAGGRVAKHGNRSVSSKSGSADVLEAAGVKLDLTPRENLAVARGLGKPSGISLDAALEKVDLYSFEDVLTRNLSAGQQRRLALARLLVTDTVLWILDEPFTSLDVHGIKVIEELLEQHTAKDGMLAVTSHHAVNLNDTSVQRINLSALSEQSA